MTETDWLVVGQVIIALAVATGKFFDWKLHQDTTQKIAAVSAKVDVVQQTTDGAAHTLASNLADTQRKNEDLIRSLAAPPASPPP
jgi:hypothetical protein